MFEPATRMFWRTYAVIAMVTIIAVSVGAALSIHTQRRLLVERERERAVAAVEMLAAALQRQVASGDVGTMHAVFRESIRERPEITSAFIAEGTGKILVHSDTTHEGQRVFDLIPAPAGLTMRPVGAAPNPSALEVTLPLRVGNHRDGALRAEVRLQRLVPDPIAASLPFAGAGALLLAVAGVATGVLSRSASEQAHASRYRRLRAQYGPALEPVRSSEPPALLDDLSVGILVVDAKTRTVRYANRCFRTLWSFNGSNGSDTAPLRYDEVIARCHVPQKVDHRGLPIPAEEIVTHHARAIRRVAVAVGPDGAPLQAHLFEDVTQRSRAEAALNAARDAAVESARAKSAFLANMTAEMRAPMQDIMEHARGIVAETGGAASQHAEDVLTRGEALLTLNAKITDYLRVEAGALGGDEDIDLHLLIADVVESFAPQAAAKGIELAWWIDSDVPPALHGKGQQLREILTKLIGNALRFTASGEVCVAASRQEDRGDDLMIRFTVRDTGRGIDPQQLPTLFTLGPDGSGGLGMLLCKQRVDAMQGTIGATNNTGCGSTFWVSVPLQPQPRSVVALPHDESLLCSQRIMIVDDNATSRSILERQLASWRIPHEAVSSAREALTRLRAAVDYGAPYALAIVDAFMPETSGLDLARSIRAESKIATLPLLLLTPGGETEARPSGDVPFEAILTKPVRPSRLYTCLAAILLANMKDATPS